MRLARICPCPVRALLNTPKKCRSNSTTRQTPQSRPSCRQTHRVRLPPPRQGLPQSAMHQFAHFIYAFLTGTHQQQFCRQMRLARICPCLKQGNAQHPPQKKRHRRPHSTQASAPRRKKDIQKPPEPTLPPPPPAPTLPPLPPHPAHKKTPPCRHRQHSHPKTAQPPPKKTCIPCIKKPPTLPPAEK